MSFWLPCLLLASLLAAATAGPVLDRRPDASRALGDGTIKVEDHRRVMRRVNEDDKIKMEPYQVNERDNDHHEEGEDDDDDDDDRGDGENEEAVSMSVRQPHPSNAPR